MKQAVIHGPRRCPYHAAVTLALLVLLSAESPSAVTDGLVGWWRLDDDSGSASADSGNSYLATLVNMDTDAAWGSGQDGGRCRSTASTTTSTSARARRST